MLNSFDHYVTEVASLGWTILLVISYGNRICNLSLFISSKR